MDARADAGGAVLCCGDAIFFGVVGSSVTAWRIGGVGEVARGSSDSWLM